MSTLMVGTQQMLEDKWYAGYNNKDKVVVTLKVEMHLHFTLKLLALIY
jgi:hypothetical protein